MKIDTTIETLTRTGGIASAGKVFEEIDLDFTSDAILSEADKQIIKTMTGFFLQGETVLKRSTWFGTAHFSQKFLESVGPPASTARSCQ